MALHFDTTINNAEECAHYLWQLNPALFKTIESVQHGIKNVTTSTGFYILIGGTLSDSGIRAQVFSQGHSVLDAIEIPTPFTAESLEGRIFIKELTDQVSASK